MAEISFETLKFQDHGSRVEAIFMRHFHFWIDKNQLEHIAPVEVEESKLIFDHHNQAAVERKFESLMIRGFHDLTSRRADKPTIYIHQNSGIPLLGSNAFGLVDRNTNIIEVKPITGCNIKCIYCSVDEDKRARDIVVEKDYVVQEFKKLVEFKGVDEIEAHIGGQSEPTMYADLAPLCRDLSKIPQVKTISIDTNATLLSEPIIDQLVEAGLNRINFSINAIKDEKAHEIADAKFYNPERVQKLIKYAAEKIRVILAPVMMEGINEDDMEDIIKFYKTLNQDNAILGIQNFLKYTRGRNPVKEMSYDKFFEKLKAWEKKYDVKLVVSEGDFKINKTESLPKPFKKGQFVTADVKCRGRFKNEYIAVAKDRTITFNAYKPVKEQVRLKITHDKHNVFYGELV